jgi:hypothetical protein
MDLERETEKQGLPNRETKESREVVGQSHNEIREEHTERSSWK